MNCCSRHMRERLSSGCRSARRILASLRDLPEIEKLEDAGLLRRSAVEMELAGMSGIGDEDAVELVEEVEVD
ncbi:MAG: hypothetical protein AB7U61_09885 [Methylocystis sp.]